jgi:hypothetical protein
MLANLCASDTIARAAVERIESLDAAQRRAERSDRRRHVARYPLRDSLCHWAAQRCRRREDDAMFVRQENRIDCDDIGRQAFAGTRDWRRWLEDAQDGRTPSCASRAPAANRDDSDIADAPASRPFSVMPIMPLSRASRAMMCSRDVNTTLPIATIPSLRIASRMTAKACWPTSPSGAM